MQAQPYLRRLDTQKIKKQNEHSHKKTIHQMRMEQQKAEEKIHYG